MQGEVGGGQHLAQVETMGFQAAPSWAPSYVTARVSLSPRLGPRQRGGRGAWPARPQPAILSAKLRL